MDDRERRSELRRVPLRHPRDAGASQACDVKRLVSPAAACPGTRHVLAVSAALRLSEPERIDLLTLTGHVPVTVEVAEPAYIIAASWDVLAGNHAFRHVWGIGEHEQPFNAIERLFFAEPARAMHGDRFVTNIAPIVAMLRSAVGRRPHLAALQNLRDKFVADTEMRKLWDVYEIGDPLVSNRCAIELPMGLFCYEALTLASPGETASSCKFRMMRVENGSRGRWRRTRKEP